MAVPQSNEVDSESLPSPQSEQPEKVESRASVGWVSGAAEAERGVRPLEGKEPSCKASLVASSPQQVTQLP